MAGLLDDHKPYSTAQLAEQASYAGQFVDVPLEPWYGGQPEGSLQEEYSKAYAVKPGLSTGAKVGIGIVILFVLVFVAVGIWYLVRRGQSNSSGSGSTWKPRSDVVIPAETAPTVPPGVSTYSPIVGTGYTLTSPTMQLCVIDYVYLGKEKKFYDKSPLGRFTDMKFASYVGGGFNSPRSGSCRQFQFVPAPGGGVYIVDPNYSPTAYLLFLPDIPATRSEKVQLYDVFISVQGLSGTLDGDAGGTLSWGSPTAFVITPLNNGWQVSFTRSDNGEVAWLAFDNLSDSNSTQVLSSSPVPFEWSLAQCPAGPSPQCTVVTPPTSNLRTIRYTL